MNKKELSEINFSYTKCCGKYYKMFAGLSSELTNIEDETIHLKIKFSPKWTKDPVSTAVQISQSWQSYLKHKNIRLTNYHVTIYFLQKREETGFCFNASVSRAELIEAINRLKKPPTPESELAHITVTGKIEDDFRSWWHDEEYEQFRQQKKDKSSKNLKISQDYRTHSHKDDMEIYYQIKGDISYRRFKKSELYWLEEGEEWNYVGALPVWGHEYWREEWVNEMKSKREKGDKIKITEKTIAELLSKEKSELSNEEIILRVLILKNPNIKIDEPEEILEHIPYFKI